MAEGHGSAVTVETIRLLGNHPVLDFLNTVDDRVSGEGDALIDHGSLVRWAVRRGVIDGDDGVELARLSSADPRAAEREFARAVDLREHLYGVFSAVAAGKAPAEADLAAVQRCYVAAVRRARPERHGPRFRWDWRPGEPSPDRIASAIAIQALELLFSDEVARLKMCPGHDCGWVFLDQSRNRSRRWCSMEGCGSRAKMRTLYRRRHASDRTV